LRVEECKVEGSGMLRVEGFDQRERKGALHGGLSPEHIVMIRWTSRHGSCSRDAKKG